MSWLRFPKTHNERKQICEFTRAKRRKLPSSWDDIINLSMRNRCWKRYRKTQYK